jgi:hypothetical protein
MRSLQFCVAFWLLLNLSGCASQTAPWQQLLTRNTTTTATVVSTDCSNHGSVTYSFNVDGHDYTNVSYWIDRPCDKIERGDPVLVYYDPVTPSTNTTMSPADALCHYQNEATVPFIVAAFLAIVGGIQIVRKLG